jgi:pimeloyl-ACP methyl ester carboxylesterase
MKFNRGFSDIPEPVHKWEVSEGLRIAADSWGDPSGPLVILLHGGGQTRHAWRKTAKNLAAAGYHAVSLDARGHGESDWSSQANYAQDDFVQDLTCVAAQLGASRPILMGASLGGNTSLIAAGEGHMDVAALILIDVVPQTERAGFDRIKTFMQQHPDGFATLEEVSAAIATYRSDRPRQKDPDGLAKIVRLGPDGRYRWHWDPRFLEGREKDFAQRHVRLSRCARQLTAPTLLVRGGSSDVVSEAGAQEFLTLCRHAEYLSVKDAGHMVSGDSNDAFGRATIDFLARHVPAPTSQNPAIPNASQAPTSTP